MHRLFNQFHHLWIFAPPLLAVTEFIILISCSRIFLEVFINKHNLLIVTYFQHIFNNKNTYYPMIPQIILIFFQCPHFTVKTCKYHSYLQISKELTFFMYLLLRMCVDVSCLDNGWFLLSLGATIGKKWEIFMRDWIRIIIYLFYWVSMFPILDFIIPSNTLSIFSIWLSSDTSHNIYFNQYKLVDGKIEDTLSEIWSIWKSMFCPGSYWTWPYKIWSLCLVFILSLINKRVLNLIHIWNILFQKGVFFWSYAHYS